MATAGAIGLTAAVAALANLPSLRGRIGWFMCTPEARNDRIHLPNVSRPRITDNDDLAELRNSMVFGLGGESTPKDAKPFTGAEVGHQQAFPLTWVSLVMTRATLMTKCGGPASLKLTYPGQT